MESRCSLDGTKGTKSSLACNHLFVLPEFLRQGDFLRPGCVSVYRGGADTRVAKPTLRQIERYARLQGSDAKAMAQSARTGVTAVDTGAVHRPLDESPRGDAVPGP